MGHRAAPCFVAIGLLSACGVILTPDATTSSSSSAGSGGLRGGASSATTGSSSSSSGVHVTSSSSASSSGAALGAPCTTGNTCESGNCVESVCCATSSCAICTSCAIPGQEGSCVAIPAGVDDTINHCEIASTCAGDGGCTGAGDAGHFGDPCTSLAGCFNSVCAAGQCKLAVGDACLDDITCVTGNCAKNRCTACANTGDCKATGKCNLGLCALPGGAPCAANGDCAVGTCDVEGFCVEQSSEPCTPTTCITHYCNRGSCSTCMVGDTCPLGTPCRGGSCLAPSGAYCRMAGHAQCASDQCPFPGFLRFRTCL